MYSTASDPFFGIVSGTVVIMLGYISFKLKRIVEILEEKK
jgi:hypothetical protein